MESQKTLTKTWAFVVALARCLQKPLKEERGSRSWDGAAHIWSEAPLFSKTSLGAAS